MSAKPTRLFCSTLAATCLALVAGAGLSGCGPSTRATSGPGVADIAAQRAEAIRLAQRAADRARAGDTDAAISLYEQSVQASPEIPAAWNNLGTLRMQAGNYAGAVTAFERAAALDPQDNRPLENTALAYSRVGWSRDALDHYVRALDINPMSITALRGAVREASRLGVADHQTLDRVFRGLSIETDEQWREFFQRQRFRIEGLMRLEDPGRSTDRNGG